MTADGCRAIDFAEPWFLKFCTVMTRTCAGGTAAADCRGSDHGEHRDLMDTSEHRPRPRRLIGDRWAGSESRCRRERKRHLGFGRRPGSAGITVTVPVSGSRCSSLGGHAAW